MIRSLEGGLTFENYRDYQRKILGMGVNDIYPRPMLSQDTIFGKEEIEDMLRIEENDVYFLYKETWDGREAKELENSHLINILLKLEREMYKNKTTFELFVLDHSSDKLLKPIYEITELAKMEPKTWLEETPIWKVLTTELKKRGLEEYYKIVSAREEAAREKRGE